MQPGHAARWWRSRPRRSPPRRAVDSSARISSQGAERASRRSIRPSRARNTRPFTWLGSQSRTVAASAWERSSSSVSRSAARWFSGRSPRSATSWRRSARVWTRPGRPAVLGSTSASGVLAPCAQHRQAAVACDGVEPGLSSSSPVSRCRRGMGRREHLLDGVLGLLGAPEHVAAERQQRTPHSGRRGPRRRPRHRRAGGPPGAGPRAGPADPFGLRVRVVPIGGSSAWATATLSSSTRRGGKRSPITPEPRPASGVDAVETRNGRIHL